MSPARSRTREATTLDSRAGGTDEDLVGSNREIVNRIVGGHSLTEAGSVIFSRRRLGVILTIAALLVALLMAGCSSEVAPTVTPSSSYSDGTAGADPAPGSTADGTSLSQPITSRWPSGIEAVVLSTQSGLYIVDEEGVKWAKSAPVADTSTTVTLSGRPVISGLDGVAVSSGNEFLAYVENGKEIVVRSIASGDVVQKAEVKTEGHTTLRAISSDGILAALVTVDPSLESEGANDEVPWTVTVVDLTTGTTTVEDELNDFVRQRVESGGRCGLVALDWLPEYKLVVGMSGDPYETHFYDPVADRLMLIPDLDYVWSHTPGGLVLGRSAAGPDQALVWNGRDGSSEPVVLDPAWPVAGMGGLNADGTALVMMVAKSDDWQDAYGWQVFRREGAAWRPDGLVAEVDWMHQPPSALSGDGNRAWTVVYRSTADNETVLLSHDFETGAWEEWFRSADMQLDLGSPYYVAVVPE